MSDENGKTKRKMTPEDLEALRLYYKPLPADHPLRNTIIVHGVPKRDDDADADCSGAREGDADADRRRGES